MFTFKALLLAATFTASEAGGSSGCPCLTAHPTDLLAESTKTTTAEAAYGPSSTAYASLSAISTYGLSTCSSWDDNENTPWYEYCGNTASGYCGKPDSTGGDDNWCVQTWCYVDPNNCDVDKVKTSVFCPAEGECTGAANTLYYSYATCGVPDCYGQWTQNAYNGTCPDTSPSEVDITSCTGDGDHATACACLGEVPAYILDNAANADYKAMVEATDYGSSCDAWDDTAGTPWYTGYCDPNEVDDYDACGANNWCKNPWCYVNPATCTVADKTSVLAPTNAHYSYEVCDAPDCYSSATADGCPHGCDSTTAAATTAAATTTGAGEGDDDPATLPALSLLAAIPLLLAARVA